MNSVVMFQRLNWTNRIKICKKILGACIYRKKAVPLHRNFKIKRYGNI